MINLYMDVAGVGVGGVVMRGLFARAAIHIACRNARGAVKAFKQNNVLIKPLQEKYRRTAEELLVIIRSSREMRQSVMDEKKKMKIPDPSIPLLLPELEAEFENTYKGFVSSMAGVMGHKVAHLTKDQVKYNLDKLHKAGPHKAPHLSRVEKHVVHGLKKSGVIKGVTHGADRIYHWFHHSSNAADHIDNVAAGADAAATAGDAALGSATDMATDSLAFPGMISAMRSIGREFKLLTEGSTSYGDSFKYGVVPTASKMLFTSIGLTLDALTGWLSMGAFSVAASWLGKYIVDQVYTDELNAQIAIMEGHAENIERRHGQALKTINEAAAGFLKEFETQVDKCPEIGSEPAMRVFIDRLREGFKKGLQAVVDNIVKNARTEIEKLPKRDWIDKILFINRSKEVADLYLQAQREIEADALGIVNAFTIAAETHAENVVDFLLRQTMFQNGETTTVLDAMEQVRLDTTSGYEKALNGWEDACIKTWTEGAQKVADISAVEHKEVEETTKFEEAGIRSARNRIAAFKVRLGHKQPAAA